MSSVRPTKVDEPNSASGIIARSPRNFSTSTNAIISIAPAHDHAIADAVLAALAELSSLPWHLTIVGDLRSTNTIDVALSADGANIDVTLNGTTTSFAAADVEYVLVAGGKQADTITVNLGDADLRCSFRKRGADPDRSSGQHSVRRRSRAACVEREV